MIAIIFFLSHCFEAVDMYVRYIHEFGKSKIHSLREIRFVQGENIIVRKNMFTVGYAKT